MHKNKSTGDRTRPLDSVKVIEMAGLAPSPYCGMLLADFGAEVMVVDRPEKDAPERPNMFPQNLLNRGKHIIRINLKKSEGLNILRKMIEGYDVLIDPYRPGVMEALGMGPEQALKINPSLIYARLTGWGQSGPYASMAGHDINYIALSGALSLFRRKGEKPLPPCNVLGDFAGGGMLCTMGILLALIERTRSGKGQVIDSAMIDGASNLITFFYALLGNGLMSLDIGTNMLDSGAPYYQTYETSDGKYIAVGAIEQRFYKEFIKGLGIELDSLPEQNDMSKWPEMIGEFARIIKTKTRDEWMKIFEGTDACVAPVLELDEVSTHPHNRERNLILGEDDFPQPAPAPRLSRTPGQAGSMPGVEGTDTIDILENMGYSKETIQGLLDNGVVE